MTTIAHMTIEDLKQFVETTLENRLTTMLGRFELAEDERFADDEADTRTWEQVKQDIERDRWTPPLGAKSSLELLREDRER